MLAAAFFGARGNPGARARPGPRDPGAKAWPGPARAKNAAVSTVIHQIQGQYSQRNPQIHGIKPCCKKWKQRYVFEAMAFAEKSEANNKLNY